MPDETVPRTDYVSLALAILQIANAATPVISEWIMLIRRKDNTVSVISMCDEASAQFTANIKQATDWMTAHGMTP